MRSSEVLPRGIPAPPQAPTSRSRLAVRAALSLVVCLLVTSSVARSQAAPPSGSPASTRGTKDLAVDLNGGLFSDTLPFDQSFNVHGDIDSSVNRIEVDFLEGTRDFIVEIDGTDPTKPARCFERPKGKKADPLKPFTCPPFQPAPPVVWQKTPGTVTGGKPTFHLQLPPLTANTYYQFRFLLGAELNETAILAFQRQARTALERILQQRTLDFRQGGFAELWSGVRDAFAKVVPKDQILLSRSSYLDPQKTSFDELDPAEQERFKLDVDAILVPQRRIQVNQPELEKEPSALKMKLDELHQRANARNGALGKLLAPCFILTLDDMARDRLARGLDPNPPAAPVGSDQPDHPGLPGQRQLIYARLFDFLRSARSCIEGRLKDGTVAKDAETLVTAGTLPREDAQALVDDVSTFLKSLDEAAELAASLSDITGHADASLAARSAALDTFINQVKVEARRVAILVNASTIGNFTAAQAQYLTMDAGFLWAPALGRSVPYLAANLYLHPLNKDVPLRQVGGWSRRFAFTLGLTIRSIADSGESRQTRRDLFDNYSLVLGAGLRLTDSVRFGAGALIFLKEDRNPLVSRQRATVSPYLSLSLDWDIAKSLQTFVKVFGT